MLNEFIDWTRSIAAGLATEAMDAYVTVNEISNNPSARLDLDTSTSVARITCWESGDYDAEVIDLESEQQIYAHRGTLKVGESLLYQFRDFFEVQDICQLVD